MKITSTLTTSVRRHACRGLLALSALSLLLGAAHALPTQVQTVALGSAHASPAQVQTVAGTGGGHKP
jgi:hypothetical protein